MSLFTRIARTASNHSFAIFTLGVLAMLLLALVLGYVPSSPSTTFRSPLTMPVMLRSTGWLKSIECNTGGQVIGVVEKNDMEYEVTFDLASGQERKLADKSLYHAHLSDHWLVYIDEAPPGGSGNYSRLKVIDINTGQEILNEDNAFQPSISGNVVVWIDLRNGTEDIYAHSLATSKEFPVVTGPGNRDYPRISGNWVIYLQRTKFPTGHETTTAQLRAHSLKTNDDFAIGNTPFANDSFQGTYHAIDGHMVAWVEFEESALSAHSLHLYDLSTRSDRILIGQDNSGLWLPSVSNDAGLLAYNRDQVLDWSQPTPELY